MHLARLIWLIENHADSLTNGTVEDIMTNPKTPSFHSAPREEMRARIYQLFRNLGRWIGTKDERHIEAEYYDLGRSRRADGVPLSEIVFAVILYKKHLRQFIQENSVFGSTLDQPEHPEMLPVLLYGIQELNYMVGHFFDAALYHTARGYESVAPDEFEAHAGTVKPTSSPSYLPPLVSRPPVEAENLRYANR